MRRVVRRLRYEFTAAVTWFLGMTLMTAAVLAACVLWGIIIYGVYKGLEWLL